MASSGRLRQPSHNSTLGSAEKVRSASEIQDRKAKLYTNTASHSNEVDDVLRAN